MLNLAGLYTKRFSQQSSYRVFEHSFKLDVINYTIKMLKSFFSKHLPSSSSIKGPHNPHCKRKGLPKLINIDRTLSSEK